VVERSSAPSLRVERRLLREGHRFVAGMDEVGRGALAGPVTVGVVVIDAGTRSAPAGVRDSKLLTPAAREALAPALRRWGVARAVGHAEPGEIDAFGIIAALRLAGGRALSALPVRPDCVLLAGSHNWLTGRPRSVSAEEEAEPPWQEESLFDWEVPVPVVATSEPVVRTLVKADRRCAAVAAASVLAKVERDAIMVERSSTYPVLRAAPAVVEPARPARRTRPAPVGGRALRCTRGTAGGLAGSRGGVVRVSPGRRSGRRRPHGVMP
jgi:ribonuclease HII